MFMLSKLFVDLLMLQLTWNLKANLELEKKELDEAWDLKYILQNGFLKTHMEIENKHNIAFGLLANVRLPTSVV